MRTWPALLLLLGITAQATTLRVSVIDSLTQAPIEGVDLAIGGEISWRGSTDGQGEVYVPADSLPLSFSLQRTGYAPIDTLIETSPSTLLFVMRPVPVTMPGVEVEGDGIAPGEWETAAVSRDTVGPVEGLYNVVESIPGVRVPETGSGGGSGGISIRGSSSLQTETWLDGMPLAHSRFGSSELDGVLPGVVERLTVFQGWTPQRLGGTGIGGGVELETLGKMTARQFRCRAGAGSYGRIEAGLGAGMPMGTGWFRAHLDLLKQENDFDYVDDNATPLNSADDSVQTRENNRIEVANLLLKGAIDSGRWGKTALISLGTWRREGVPGPAALPLLHVTHEAWEERLILKHLFELGRHTRGTTTLFQEWFDSEVDDGRGELAFLPSLHREGGSSSGGRLFMTGGTWNHLKADARLEGRWERFHSEVEGIGALDREQHRRTLAGGAGLTWLCVDNARIRGEMGLISYADEEDEGDESSGSVATYRAAGEYAVLPDLTVALSWSVQARPPTLFELYGNQGSVKGNADLEPEEGTQIEAVVLGWQGRLRIAAYHRKVENLIQFWLRSPRVILPENVGEAVLQGVEAGINSVLIDPVSLTAHGSYQETEDRSNVPYYRGNDLPGGPKWRGFLGAHARLMSHVHAGVHVRVESDFYLDRANRRPEGSAIKLGAWLEVREFWNLVFRVTGENLTDETGNDQWGYPLPGRRLRATVSYPAIG